MLMAEAITPEVAGVHKPDLRVVSSEVIRTDHTTYTPEGARVHYRKYAASGAHETEAPFFVVSGFAGIAEAYGPMCETLAALGEEAYIIDPVRAQPWKHELRPGQIITAHRLASRGIRAALTDMRESHGVEQAHAIVHSKAGRDIMWTAHHMPEYLSSITFLGSVGLGHNMSTIIAGVPSFIAEDVPSLARGIPQDARNLDNALDLVKYFVHRPHRVLAEIALIARADIRASLPLIQANGIKTAVVEFANDRLLPPEHTTRDIQELADYYGIFQGGPAGHGAPIDQAVALAHELITIRDTLTS